MTSHTSIIYISTIKAVNIDQYSLLHCKTGYKLHDLETNLWFYYLAFRLYIDITMLFSDLTFWPVPIQHNFENLDLYTLV